MSQPHENPRVPSDDRGDATSPTATPRAPELPRQPGAEPSPDGRGRRRSRAARTLSALRQLSQRPAPAGGEQPPAAPGETDIAMPTPRTTQDPATPPAPGTETDESPGQHPSRFPTLTLRRWLPQALALACLAGGAGTLLVHDKDVTLTVDGEPRTLHTFASDVEELLDEEGLRIGSHDIVAPSRHQQLSDGDEVAVRYGRPMRLTLDGRQRRVWTTAETVSAALGQLGVRAEGADVSASRSARIARQGMSLDVWTARRVTFRADGEDHVVRTTSRTVREALKEAGLALKQQDRLSISPRAFPGDGEVIEVTRDRVVERTREERIPFRTVRREDPSLLRGREVVERSGRSGVRRVAYEQRVVDGEPKEERKLDSEVVRKARKRLVRVGTREPRPAASPAPRSTASGGKKRSAKAPSGGGGGGGQNWSALARCESSGNPNAVDASGNYGGLYQFDTRTWHSVGGSGRPQDASAAEQTARAKKLYASRGASPWPVCGRKLSR